MLAVGAGSSASQIRVTAWPWLPRGPAGQGPVLQPASRGLGTARRALQPTASRGQLRLRSSQAARVQRSLGAGQQEDDQGERAQVTEDVHSHRNAGRRSRPPRGEPSALAVVLVRWSRRAQSTRACAHNPICPPQASMKALMNLSATAATSPALISWPLNNWRTSASP